MKSWLKRQTWVVLGLGATLMGGLIAASVTTAEASPRRYARDWDRADVRYSRAWDRDGDRIPNHRDWDRDGDGIANYRDRHPNTPDRYAYQYRPGSYRYTLSAPSRGRDLDRDCVPNYRDWDRDGDRVSNARDRYPNNRWRR